MPDEQNLESTSEVSSDVSSPVENSTPETTTESTPVENQPVQVDQTKKQAVPQKKSILAGDGDIQKPDNYIDGLNIPESEKQILRDRIKHGLSTRQAVAEKTIQKIKAEQKKYGFNDINELKSMIASNQDIQTQLRALQEQEAQVEQSIQAQNVDIEWASKSWNGLDDNQRKQLFEAMTPDQRVLLKNNLVLEETRKAESNQRFNQLHSENEKKHGEGYKKALPEMMNHFSQNYFNNAPEYVYKAMNYEKYGKEQYEKGLKERQNTASVVKTQSSSDKTNVKYESTLDALKAALDSRGVNYNTVFNR